MSTQDNDTEVKLVSVLIHREAWESGYTFLERVTQEVNKHADTLEDFDMIDDHTMKLTYYAKCWR